MTVRRLVLLLGVMACGQGAGDALDDSSGPAPDVRPSGHVGAPAPALHARTLDGTPVTLAALRGRPVLLNVWATWCHPCQDEIPVLEALYRQHRPRGLEMIGVTIDDEGKTGDIRAFARRFGMTYPVWHDPDQRVMPAFNVVGVPTSFLIGRDGRVLWRRTGEVRAGDPSLAAALDSVFTPKLTASDAAP